MEFDLTTLIVATGALGTSSYGIVDGMKDRNESVGHAGLTELKTGLNVLLDALEQAYGNQQFEELLHAKYREEREQLELFLRQGVRIGLTSKNANCIANKLGGIDGDALSSAITFLEENGDLADVDEHDDKITAAKKKKLREYDDAQRILARYEVIADARIDGAITLSRARYKGTVLRYAMGVAVLIGISAGFCVGVDAANSGLEFANMNRREALIVGKFVLMGLFTGLAAVPIAPVAKDIANAIRDTSAALKGRVNG